MPISLRLPAEIETQIAGFSARLGLSKSAIIVRSIREFLAKNAEPSSLQIYEDVMRGASGEPGNGRRETAERRPRKIQARDAIRRKHARRSETASQALAKPRSGASRSS